jgi:hypothetical protein
VCVASLCDPAGVGRPREAALPVQCLNRADAAPTYKKKEGRRQGPVAEDLAASTKKDRSPYSPCKSVLHILVKV